VQTPDNEQFEAYLKRFHPIAPEPVPTLSVGPSSRRSPPLEIWLAPVAAILAYRSGHFACSQSNCRFENR
jgi:hypothetical protein